MSGWDFLGKSQGNRKAHRLIIHPYSRWDNPKIISKNHNFSSGIIPTFKHLLRHGDRPVVLANTPVKLDDFAMSMPNSWICQLAMVVSIAKTCRKTWISPPVTKRG
jgi:hypothetical protein